MNKELQEAEEALSRFLSEKTGGVEMKEVLRHYRDKIDEAELRAAVWTLRAQGTLDFKDGKLFQRTLAAA